MVRSTPERTLHGAAIPYSPITIH